MHQEFPNEYMYKFATVQKCDLKLHKFETTNNNFEKNQLFDTCVMIKRTCISIFSKLGLVHHTNLFVKKLQVA